MQIWQRASTKLKTEVKARKQKLEARSSRKWTATAGLSTRRHLSCTLQHQTGSRMQISGREPTLSSHRKRKKKKKKKKKKKE